MKKLFLVLFLTTSIFAADKYYARIKMPSKEIDAKFMQESTIVIDSSNLNYNTFEISQAEYEGSINQATIDAAYTVAIVDKKDINKRVDEILICAMLVLLDYQNNDIRTQTPTQFRADVIAKYNARNP